MLLLPVLPAQAWNYHVTAKPLMTIFCLRGPHSAFYTRGRGARAPAPGTVRGRCVGKTEVDLLLPADAGLFQR
jgi:hypothetical protein